MSQVSDKLRLRSEMKARRRAYAASLDGATRDALEQALGDALAPLITTANSVAAYAPMKDEVGVFSAVFRERWAHAQIAFPFFVDRDSRMTFRVGDPVDPGPWGILQPAADAAILDPDLILVPLVAIDRTGNRIGMGKGHYDRALPGLRDAGARLIGCGWSFQRIDQIIAPDAWDIPLDGFASPDGLEMFR